MRLVTCNTRRKEAGFTLIEMIITIVLIGIIAGIAAMLIREGMRGYSDQETLADLTNQARLGIERMAREIRTIRYCTATDITTFTAGTLSFVDITGTAIAYTTAGGNLTRNGTTLSSDVSALNFSYFRRSGAASGSAAQIWVIQVDLTVTKSGESQSFRIRVHPRGFLPADCG